MSLNINKDHNVHFIGIGGVSMSGLAEILINRGYKVSGSDMNSSPITNHLEKIGVKIYIGQKKENLNDVGAVVYTAAISNDNEELIAAKKLNVPLFNRAQFLGEIMKDFHHNIAVSGTHGKTTTTSMYSHVLLSAELDPTILVGGKLDIIDGYVRCGKSDFFLTEACEYKASFLSFFPTIGVILNIDADHLDYYKDINEIEETFKKFAHIIPKDGYLIANAEDKKVMEVAETVNCNVLSFGIDSGDVKAENVSFDERSRGSFDVIYNGEKILSITLKVPGRHNILNALSTVAGAIAMGIPYDKIKSGLEDFHGTNRRFEYKGKKNGVTIIDDYAHHPKEIKATLAAAKNFPHKKLVIAFQPHTYTRTKSLFKEFSEVFDDVDELILADIYAAREKDTGIVSSQMLCDAIKERGVNAINIHSFDEIESYLEKTLEDGDLFITVGAGDIFKVGEALLDK